jgi:hypothetical protein
MTSKFAMGLHYFVLHPVVAATRDQCLQLVASYAEITIRSAHFLCFTHGKLSIEQFALDKTSNLTDTKNVPTPKEPQENL